MPAPSNHTLRLFIALWPSAHLAGALRARCQLGHGGGQDRAVALEKLHLTLHFLGAVPQPLLAKLVPALQVPMRPFELLFSHCQAWPGGLVVALPDAAAPELVELHAALGQALTGLGLPVDGRAFEPHVTLARRHAVPLGTGLGPPLHWPVQGYVLAQAKTAPRGGYCMLRRYHANGQILLGPC